MRDPLNSKAMHDLKAAHAANGRHLVVPDTTTNLAADPVRELLPSVGSRWMWEPYQPRAREEVVVTSHEHRNGEWWVVSKDERSGYQPNPFDRWIEATVMLAPAPEDS